MPVIPMTTAIAKSTAILKINGIIAKSTAILKINGIAVKKTILMAVPAALRLLNAQTALPTAAAANVWPPAFGRST